MKTYTKSILTEPTEWGDTLFEWTDGKVSSTCVQKSVQPARHFEQLLKEAGYEPTANMFDNCVIDT